MSMEKFELYPRFLSVFTDRNETVNEISDVIYWERE